MRNISSTSHQSNPQAYQRNSHSTLQFIDPFKSTSFRVDQKSIQWNFFKAWWPASMVWGSTGGWVLKRGKWSKSIPSTGPFSNSIHSSNSTHNWSLQASYPQASPKSTNEPTPVQSPHQSPPPQKNSPIQIIHQYPPIQETPPHFKNLEPQMSSEHSTDSPPIIQWKKDWRATKFNEQIWREHEFDTTMDESLINSWVNHMRRLLDDDYKPYMTFAESPSDGYWDIPISPN